MENAFDRMNLSFLADVLRAFGFSEEFVELIQACTMGPWIAPLINGRTCKFFQISRGLRQGCPLSPLLYIIMADSLSRNLEHCRSNSTLIGLSISRGTKRINHSLFENDTLLLGGASCIVAKIFKAILDSFMEVSVGLINNGKSCLCSWNTPIRTLQKMSQILNIPC